MLLNTSQAATLGDDPSNDLQRTSAMSPSHLIRASFLHCLGDPALQGNSAIDYVEDGACRVENGVITEFGDAKDLVAKPDEAILDYRGKLIVPGFVDTHIHYPQVEVIASYGARLLDWLETYTFPCEAQFSDNQLASETAEFFIQELLKNGTTTALVFGTSHKGSVEALFTAAQKRQLRLVAGKVMMDRNAPESILDTVASSYNESKDLIERWHGKERLGYAVTPRFAPTSTKEQLDVAGQLLREYPDVHLHTHLSENLEECDWVAELFPDSTDYLDVYEQSGLVRRRSMFAHCIHLSDREWSSLSEKNASVSHCAMSNLFIGSGLFNYAKAVKENVQVGLGTDVGGGDSFSILRACNETYKVQQLQKNSISPGSLLYLATLGGARALDLDAHIGNFTVGKEADMVVLDEKATPLLARKSKTCKNWDERLFSLLMLGDDRAVYDTLILGKSVKHPTSVDT